MLLKFLNRLEKTLSIFILIFFIISLTATSVSAGSATKAVVSISFDDNDMYQVGILDGKGVQGTIAYVTRDIYPSDLTSMHKEEKKGWEIASHTVNHTADSEIEFSNSIKYLVGQGFTVNGFVVPCGGPLTDTQVGWASKYYKWSRNCVEYTSNPSSTAYYNYPPINKYQLIGVTPNGHNLSDLKKLVDTANKKHYWLIFAFHRDEITNKDLKSLIDYTKSKNIQILPINKAINVYSKYGTTSKFSSNAIAYNE